VTQSHDETVAAGQVSGTFHGSPIQLDFQFTIDGDKLAASTIRG
jgi:hypothetical protein